MKKFVGGLILLLWALPMLSALASIFLWFFEVPFNIVTWTPERVVVMVLWTGVLSFFAVPVASDLLDE